VPPPPAFPRPPVKLPLPTVEEPLSCLASLILTLIFLTEFVFYQKILQNRVRERKLDRGPSSSQWQADLPLYLALLSHLTWAIEYAGSTLFHHHEIPFFERWDYCGAIVAFGVNIITNEVLVKATRPRAHQAVWTTRCTIVTTAVVALVCWSVHHLLAVHFDYGLQNKTVGLLVVCHAVQWTTGMWRSGDWHRWSNSARYTALTLGITVAALPAEVGPDFAPIAGIVDGHGLWHACGIGIALSWAALVRERTALLAPKAATSVV